METSTVKIDEKRISFKTLLLKNPNYFGNLTKSDLKPVFKMAANVTYEELTCVGFNPATNLLEATVAIKQPTGYNGNLCTFGSTEYVRFFVDYGKGWQDVGLIGIGVHDIPTGTDCMDQLNKPLTYVASIKIQPPHDCCNHPLLPKVHAILSWNWVPPAGAANVGWQPPWGNTKDCQIQIGPGPWNIFCVIGVLNQDLEKKLVVPKLIEEIQDVPIPIPDPAPYTLTEVAKLYETKANAKAAASFSVEPHRFALKNLQPILASEVFDTQVHAAKSAELATMGLSFESILDALAQLNANVTYEQLECLGLDNNMSRIAATFRVKKPVGYSGDLCHAGSKEYIAFWADWDNKCNWTYLGTSEVNVHDISSIPATGLCYAAFLPVDFTKQLKPCIQPRIVRLRAVLSWAVPPSTTNPDALTYWGNRIDTHVQLMPGLPSTTPFPTIWVLGGIPLSMIDPVTGMTTSSAVFADNGLPPDAHGRPCPFGLRVNVKGPTFPGYQYRVQVKRVSDPPLAWTTVTTPMTFERADTSTYVKYPDTIDGYFNYVPFYENVNSLLAFWDTNSLMDDLWIVKLDIKGVAGDITHLILIDNTAPSVDIHIDGLGDCKDFVENSTITGKFVARDIHFGSFQLSTLPNTATTPANNPTTLTPSTLQTAVSPGDAWSLNTNAPVQMKPCGYVVLVEAWDRSILNSASQGNYKRQSVGLCLRATGT
jgi:hypothetical protein